VGFNASQDENLQGEAWTTWNYIAPITGGQSQIAYTKVEPGPEGTNGASDKNSIFREQPPRK
jgi:hypothetical protein